jgi:hypothetical protein
MSVLVKWFICGSDHAEGFKALKASIKTAHKIFGHSVDYVICCNNTSGSQERYLRPLGVPLYHQNSSEINLTQNCPSVSGTMWKLCPARLNLAGHEISIDNDLVLLKLHDKLKHFLESRDVSVMAESSDFSDVHGRFNPSTECSLNSGLVGFPPGLDVDELLPNYLRCIQGDWGHHDEQGLTASVLLENSNVSVVSRDSILLLHRHDRFSGLADGLHFIGVNREGKNHLPWMEFRRYHTLIL